MREELKNKINRNSRLKKMVLWCLISPRRTAPRWWVRWFVNPFFTHRGRGSRVKCSARLNVSPIQEFRLGRRSVIENYVTIDNGVGAVCIGDDSRIGIGNTLIGPVRIGNRVMLAQHVVLSGLNHNYLDPERPIREQGVTTRGITVEDDVWIGAHATLTAGVTIGRHSVVAAGSVVVKDIPPYSVCAGVPAQVIKYYDADQRTWVRAKRNEA